MSSNTRGIPLSFDKFLAQGTVGSATVSVQMDAEVIGEMERTADRLEKLLDRRKRRGPVDDEALSAAPSALDDEIAKLEAHGEELHARFQAGLAEWTLTAPTQIDMDDIVEQFPNPKPPQAPVLPDELPEDASSGATKRYARRMKALKPLLERYEQEVREWRKQVAAIEIERNCAIIASATATISTTDGEIQPPSAADVLAMYAKPHGKSRYERLLAAVNDALVDEVEVDRPTLPES